MISVWSFYEDRGIRVSGQPLEQAVQTFKLAGLGFKWSPNSLLAKEKGLLERDLGSEHYFLKPRKIRELLVFF